MESSSSLTLATFSDIGLELAWPEAVAVTLEVADRVSRAGGALVTPDARHVVLDAEGSVSIVPGSPIPAHPVRQAATLLRDLLDDASAPAELRDFVAQNTRERPACAWIEEFTTALHYFERPRRQEILADVARRAISAQESLVAADAAAETREDAGGSADAPRGLWSTLARLFGRS